jgi:N-acetylmuramoyl-L-alanine amidase
MKFLIKILLLTNLCAGCTIHKKIVSKKDRFKRSTHLNTYIALASLDHIDGLDLHKVQYFEDPYRNHFDDRVNADVKMIVMHYTVGGCMSVLHHFTKPVKTDRVSSHYVITEREVKWWQKHGIAGGQIVQVVPEEKRAWHAGNSKWQDLENVNHWSIGIENVNKGFIKRGKNKTVWYNFDEEQIHNLGLLTKRIVDKYNINPTKIVGHSDIAPGRKQDPGILFPWGELYRKHGLGAWLEDHERDVEYIKTHFNPDYDLPEEIDIEFVARMLYTYGYDLLPKKYSTEEERINFENVLLAFKMHFSENQNIKNHTNELTYNDQLWIWGLVAKYKEFLPIRTYSTNYFQMQLL